MFSWRLPRVPCKDSDQIMQMHRLTWVFGGHTWDLVENTVPRLIYKWWWSPNWTWQLAGKALWPKLYWSNFQMLKQALSDSFVGIINICFLLQKETEQRKFEEERPYRMQNSWKRSLKFTLVHVSYLWNCLINHSNVFICCLFWFAFIYISLPFCLAHFLWESDVDCHCHK